MPSLKILLSLVLLLWLFHHFALCARWSEDAINASKGEQIQEEDRRGEKRTLSSGSLFVSLSFSLCAGTKIALRSLYSSACEPCVLLRSLAEASVHWSVQLRGLRALTKLPQPACAGREWEASVPDASSFSLSKCSVIPPGILYRCDVNFPWILN